MRSGGWKSIRARGCARATPASPRPARQRRGIVAACIACAIVLLLGAPPATAGDAVAPQTGMWETQAEVTSLPTTGSAWNKVAADARATWPAANISDQDNQHGTYALAGALYYARTADAAMRTKVRNAIMAARETENGGRVLALARNLVPYVLAADLINLASYSAADDAAFRTWLGGVRTEAMTECTNLKACHEKRPNNWGTHSGASRIAADIYLGDTADLAAAASVFHGWVGDRAAYAGFSYGDLSWQCDTAAPVGVNKPGCTKSGHDIDGVVADDQRRCGTFVWPPCKTNYAWETLQGAVVQAYLLDREGYDSWNWGSQAILRAADWLYRTTFADGSPYPPVSDDTWIPWLVNAGYGTTFATVSPTSPGKNIGYTDWTSPLAPAPSPPPDTTAPAAPGGLTSTNVTATSATFGWTASNDNVGVDRYEVFADGTLFASTTSLSSNVTGLTCGTAHVLGVQARDAAGNVSSRSELTVTTAACPAADTQAPTAPANVRATATAETSIAIAWDIASDNVGVAGYKVFRNGAFVADVTAGTSFTFTGLTCGTSYLLEVSAFDAAGNVGARGSLTASTSACPPAGDTAAPAAPANLRSTGSTQTTATVAWDAAQDNVGVTGYLVFLDGIQVADAKNVLTFTYTGLSCATTHTAQVKAYDAAGNVSALSSALGFTTAACASTTTTVTPAADAYVDANAPASNFGAATVLFVHGSPVRRAYLRFAVPAATPKSAVLRFWSNTSSSSGVSVSKATGTTATTWGESSLTFQNAPTFGTAIATKPSVTVGANDIAIPVAQLTPGAAVTLVITRTATSRTDVQSKENTNKPALVITT
jgi:chitodextrinase